METRDLRTNIIDLRTHLTVANLATAQLRRKSPRTEESARLFAHLDRALTQMERDACRMEATLEAKERHATRWPNPFRVLFGMAAAGAMMGKMMKQLAQGRGQREMLRSLP